MVPDWQLPPGVDRGLWDYVHNTPMAQSYDEALAGTPLLEADLRFAERFFKRPGRLVDLGCGTGRLMVHFARRGFSCVGVDLSEMMLEQVANKAQRENLAIAWVKANLVELDGLADSIFDYAACLFSTLGMIRLEENRHRFLQHVFRILRPEGCFVLHVHNRSYRFGRGLGKRGEEPGDRTMPQTYGGAELTLHHFTRREIVRALRKAGFSICKVKPIGLSADGDLAWAWLLPSFRSYGYLLSAVK
jgi:ubiquinone/menaquinone biosynthesis C-methylase UbiE